MSDPVRKFAEKIVKATYDEAEDSNWLSYNAEVRLFFKEKIETLLREAMDAPFKVFASPCGCLTWKHERPACELMRGIKAARSAAFREAAEIAENGPPPGTAVRCDGDVRDPGVVVTGYMKWIANRIRSRASGLGKP